MNNKVQKRISIIFTVAILLLAVVALAVFQGTATPVAQAATGDQPFGEYVGTNGQIEHRTKAQIAALYGVNESYVLEITNSGATGGRDLYNFLNGSTNYQVAFLSADVGIAYNANLDGYYNTGVSSSNAIFDKVFDGNGYTLKLYGGAGEANSQEHLNDGSTRRKARRNGLDPYGRYDAWYEFTGYLVAENYGKINNLTIDYTSPHIGYIADLGKWQGGDLQYSESSSLCSRASQAGGFVAGVITGLNGYGGVIDNVKLQLNNPFTVIKKMGKQNVGYLTENFSYAGGIAGRIEENSTLTNCWVDIPENSGVFNAVVGKSGNWGSDKHYGLSLAGGVVGNIDKGTAQLKYCAISGEGTIRAFVNSAVYFRSYAGGISAGCIEITNTENAVDVNSDSNVAVNPGQVQGIVSSWHGKRFDNYDISNGKTKSSMGLLFDAVGTNVSSLAILYDLELLMETNPESNVPHSSDGKLTCDSSGNLRAWVEIYPKNEGGKLTASFDTAKAGYDIKVKAIADGHDEAQAQLDAIDTSSISGVPYVQLPLTQGETGGIIWSARFESESDPSDHFNLQVDDPIYAEVYLLSSGKIGKYIYEFGTMESIAYGDTNGQNRNLFRSYNGQPLQLPKVTMPSNPAFDTSVFNTYSDLWKITYTGINSSASADVALGQTYMPGNYTMCTQAKVGDRTYGYYNEDSKILAWQPSTLYTFTILQGTLAIGDRSTSTDGWQRSVTFELKMNAESDFDFVKFQRNGLFPEDAAVGFDRQGASTYYTVDKGTGKNGARYTFFAYKKDPISNQDVLVATSESRTVKIDTDAPEISELEYYMVENGKERLLTEAELEDIQLHWTKNPILVKYNVTDNGKSGVGSAETDNSYIENVELENGDYDVVVTIKDSLPKTLTYADARGNTTVLDLQLNVDTVQAKLLYLYDNYRIGDGLTYSREDVTVNYRATFGSSGWRLYYSYEKDAGGNDIWVPRADQDQMVNSGAYKNFVINWNMGDIGGRAADFKMKMVNLAGLYDDVYPEGKEGGKIGEYVIWRRIADIYISTDLDNIFLDGSGEKLSVKQILDSGEGAKYFDKEYDGTNAYEGKKEYAFYMDVSDLQPGFAYNDRLGILYSTAYYNSRPAIRNLGVDGKLPVELVYLATDAGATQLRFSVPLSGDDYYNYAIYFTNDLSKIDFDNDISAEYGTYWASYDIDATINKRQVAIELKDMDELKADFYFGDEIPTGLEVFVEQTNADVPISLKTGASATANIGEYTVEGSTPKYANVEYVVNPTSITIKKRPINVELRYDGGEVGNIPTGEQAGTTHYITGTYKDVNGVDQPIVVKYFLNDREEEALAKVGTYRFDISITDPNYVIDGQTSFKFAIQKGYLKVTMGLREVDYTESKIEYNPIIPIETLDLYEQDDLQITYFKYRDDTKYDPITGQITGGGYDKNSPLAEAPTERGLYRVELIFAGNANFFRQEYDAGVLSIVKAATDINVEVANVEHGFDNRLFSFNVKDAVTEVRSSSDNLLWDSSKDTDGVIKVYYQNVKDGKYLELPKQETAGEGWYSEVGTYRYKIEYLGAENYNRSELIVNMTITKANFKNIGFSKDVYEFTYDGEKHLPEVKGLGAYFGISERYQVNQSTAGSLSEFNIADAGEYNVTLRTSLDGYEDATYRTKVVIKKAQMKNVSANIIEADYDGTRHYISFNGLKGTVEDGLYYEDGITPGGVRIIVGGDSEGITYAVNVKIDSATGEVTNHGGSVTLSANNYEDLHINTYIKINQIYYDYISIGKSLPNKIPSGTSVSGYNGFVEDSSGKRNCALQYFDMEGKLVVPDENGVLPDGKYEVRLKVPDNYKIDYKKVWRVEVGEINNSQLSTVGIVAVAAVALVLAGAVVTAVVVVKKRKKAGIV